jgi:hypothetical protein
MECVSLTNGNTFYPGIGADEAMAELHGLVGQITSTWAEVEDGLFHIFVIAIAGTFFVGDLRPYRSVFFTFSSYEGKMRMVHNAMNTKYSNDEDVSAEWKELRRALNGFASLRNDIAHLIPKAKTSTDPTAKANVRLVPAFWRSAFQEHDFDKAGYSIDELWQALAPYWGYHPRINLNPPSGEARYQLGYRLQQFAEKLEPSRPSPPSTL